MNRSYSAYLLLLLLSLGILARAQSAATNDVEVKGFHLDLRIQVMTMPALKAFVKNLSDHGMNTLVMEWEGTYPFKKHPLIANRFAYRREEVMDFIQYCNKLRIDVIPLQQSFGHVEYILRHYLYKDLREDQKDYSQINPLKEALSKQLFTDLYKDLASTHTSNYIHIGGDETYLLGHSDASKAKVAAVGKGRLYGDYIKLLCEIVVSLGKRPVLWADIALKYPEALQGLPKETVFVDWNYGWDINMFGDHAKLMQSGFEIWGSPAIRSHPDNYFLTQWEKHFNNIRDFVPKAKAFGYKGIIMTSWSTSGLYATRWESTKDIVDLYAIRRVYPITGFNMLIDAFFKSVQEDKPLAINDFVYSYAKDKYGLSQEQALAFWNALRAAPYEVNQGIISDSKMTISQLLDSAKMTTQILQSLKPIRNKKEFAHYGLMAAIREQYLTYMALETRINNSSFREEEIPLILKQLKELQMDRLDKEFLKLNKDAFFKAELEQENQLRNSKINALYERLSRKKI